MKWHKFQDRLHVPQISDSVITSEQNTDTEQCEATSNTLCTNDEIMPEDVHSGTKYDATIHCDIRVLLLPSVIKQNHRDWF